MDTALEMPGINVKPRVIENYDGKDIKLSDSIVMKVEDFPILKEKIGKTLVVTDGNTLLGGDDKAGIAIIMALCEFLMKNKDFHMGTSKLPLHLMKRLEEVQKTLMLKSLVLNLLIPLMEVQSLMLNMKTLMLLQQ